MCLDIGPQGSNFDPPLVITVEYDPESLDEGVVEENLVFAYFDVETEQWVQCSCMVNTEAHVIIAQISHCSVFTVLSEAPPPFFALSNLAVSSTEVTSGQSTTVSVDVQNTGDVESSYVVKLKINGAVEETRDITLAGGDTTTVSFTVSKDTPGTYVAEIGGQSGEFTVVESATSISWSVIITIIAGVMAVVFIVLSLYYWRNPRRPAEVG